MAKRDNDTAVCNLMLARESIAALSRKVHRALSAAHGRVIVDHRPPFLWQEDVSLEYEYRHDVSHTSAATTTSRVDYCGDSPDDLARCVAHGVEKLICAINSLASSASTRLQ